MKIENINIKGEAMFIVELCFILLRMGCHD